MGNVLHINTSDLVLHGNCDLRVQLWRRLGIYASGNAQQLPEFSAI